MRVNFMAFAPAGPQTAAPGPENWPGLMARALSLARKAVALGEIPVGAVVLAPSGEIVGTGKNEVEARRDPTAHAEILAIRAACQHAGNWRLAGHVLVCTLEPCPMCAAAICETRLAGVVFGATDPKRGAIVSRAEYLAVPPVKKGIWHMGGICAHACAALLNDFFREARER